MKLVSFAVVSFLAAMASAGFSETPGDADYTAHQLEKRDIVDDMKKQLEEGVEQGMKDYRDILGEYWDMRHRESNLETGLFQARFAFKDSDYGPSGPTVNGTDTIWLEYYTKANMKHVTRNIYR
ncbi:hypothetical protein BASA62_004088 [Batrachochytrium salamandrivorans]|nr:hypothetical protein BASA62_004088 [Batrachochytrium salamandrivorans]